MTNEIWMRAVVDVIVFLGMSGDDFVDEDAAVRQLESLAATLKDLGDHEKLEFRRFVERRAEQELHTPGNEEIASFLSQLCDDLGL